MKLNRKIVCLLCAALLFLLLACSGGGQYVYVDADGNAYWEPVEGAVEYEAELRHEESGEESTFRPDANTTTAEVPAGCTIRVRAVFEDESTGEWIDEACGWRGRRHKGARR